MGVFTLSSGGVKVLDLVSTPGSARMILYGWGRVSHRTSRIVIIENHKVSDLLSWEAQPHTHDAAQ